LFIFCSVQSLLLRKLYKKGIWVIAAKRKGVYVPP
jgi:hypothetical protein